MGPVARAPIAPVVAAASRLSPWRLLLLFLAIAAALLATLLTSAPATAQVLTPEQATRVGGDLMTLKQKLASLQQAAIKVHAAAPTVIDELAAALGRVRDAHSADDRARMPWLATLAFVLLIAVVAAWRRATRSIRARRLDDPLQARGAAGLIALDLVEWCLLAGAAYLAIEAFFSATGNQDLMVVAVLWAVVRWRLLLLLLEVVLRPRLARFRLIDMSDGVALQVKWLVASVTFLGILGISVMPVLLRAGLPVHAGQVIVLAQGLLVALGCAIALARYRAAYALPPLRARIWVGIGATVLLLLWLVWTLSVLALQFSIYHSLVASLRIVAFAYVADALLGLSARAGWVQFLRRSVTTAAALAIGILLAETWLVEEFAVLPLAEWLPIRRSLVSAALTLFIGYVAWRYLHQWTEERLHAVAAGLGPEADDEVAAPASRLTTALPMLRILAGITILVVAALLALSQLGVEITPLLAGAGVFGLAVSFGSQALVRDIVSGVFFMLDDAFRVGEYIDTGRLKGTVERISLRSVRLRHQNGQVHTIPYGQLTAITNFSRDWQTVKFTLRLARNVDLERVRKCTKKVGLELQADPEFGKELILPLKMQGVSEIADNALIVRFKFTVKPSNPSWVQREYTKRLYKAFAAEGIEFASAAITVQSADGSVIPPALAGAAGAAAAEGAAAPGDGSAPSARGA
jgi:small-conductance mechanosensitive channel